LNAGAAIRVGVKRMRSFTNEPLKPGARSNSISISKKMSHRSSSCVALFLALVASMASAQTPTPGPSGIEGVIMVSPSRPGPIRTDSPSAAPAGNLQFVVTKADTRVASFTTDAEGRFRISLPPGHYTVLREDPGARIGHWRFEVDVVAGSMAKVNWIGDSGMR
jgi:hypothetical protein